jgi:hypothetical protein
MYMDRKIFEVGYDGLGLGGHVDEVPTDHVPELLNGDVHHRV